MYDIEVFETEHFTRLLVNGKSVAEVTKDGQLYICSDATVMKEVKVSPYFNGKIVGIGPKHV